MKDRIRQVRKSLGLKQSEFGAVLGLSQSAVTAYEGGSRVPIDAVVKAICKEFHVSEDWLRTGEGEMFVPITRDELVAEFVGRAMADESKVFQRHMLSVLSRLSLEQWELLEEIARKLAEEQEKDGS